jgi:predicted nucleic acid-binding protein
VSGFLLDTNVISELVKPRPESKVTAWISSVDERMLWLSILTLGEIRKGVACLPSSARRLALEGWLEFDLPERFHGRILSVDQPVADRWGRLSAEAIAKKMILPVIDGLLAATALQHGLSLVTRNSRDIEATGVPFVNPWL